MAETEKRKPGRPKGSLNKNTEVVRRLANKFTPEAVRTLAMLMKSAESEMVRKAAADSLLDRAVGKPAQAITGHDGGALQLMSKVIHEHLAAVPRVEVQEIEADSVKVIGSGEPCACGCHAGQAIHTDGACHCGR